MLYYIIALYYSILYHSILYYIISYYIIDIILYYIILYDIIAYYSIFEGSLEVKLPTIWTDEKQSRAEAERRGRLEERRSEEKE